MGGVNLQQYQIESMTAENVSAHAFRIRCLREDADTGAQLNDWTAPANAVKFLFNYQNVNLSAEERRELVEMISVWLLTKRAENGPV